MTRLLGPGDLSDDRTLGCHAGQLRTHVMKDLKHLLGRLRPAERCCEHGQLDPHDGQRRQASHFHDSSAIRNVSSILVLPFTFRQCTYVYFYLVLYFLIPNYLSILFICSVKLANLSNAQYSASIDSTIKKYGWGAANALRDTAKQQAGAVFTS